MIVTRMCNRVLEVCLIGGEHDGEIALIPRITLTPTPSAADVTFKFKWCQFPVQLAFALSINKSQGQSVWYVLNSCVCTWSTLCCTFTGYIQSIYQDSSSRWCYRTYNIQCSVRRGSFKLNMQLSPNISSKSRVYVVYTLSAVVL